MGRSTTAAAARSFRISPFYRGLAACALLLGACDTAPLDESGSADAGTSALGSATAPDAGSGVAVTTGSADLVAKIDPRLLGNSVSNPLGDVVVMLDERFVPAAAPTDDPIAAPAAVAAGASNATSAPTSAPTTASNAAIFRRDLVAARMSLAKDGLIARLGAHRLVTVNRFQNLPAMHLRVDSLAALMALAADPAVARLAPNEKLTMLDTVPADLTLINQPKAAAANKLGAGATVAVLDTGTDYKRAPFNCTAAGAAGCPVVYAADFAPQDNNVDDNGHGTNVSGIVLSVAPSAQIIALDVFNGSGAATTDIMAAIDWCIQNKVKYNIASINMSLGGGLSTTTCATDPLAVSISKARTAGILSAVASGNAGSTNAISSPACGPDAVSVGAVHAANLGNLQWSICGDATTKADQIACFSCSSSFLTVLAPGVMITAAGITMSGTSQATPHVAGAIAVLRAAFPSDTPTATVTRLTTYGVPVKDPRNGITKPRLDLYASLTGTAPAPAPVAGPIGTISLAAKAAYTKTAAISAALATTSGTATQMCVTESATCTTWVPTAATLAFTLSAGDGTKTVRAWWKDAAGNISAAPATASIILDTTAPTGGAFTATATALQATFAWSGFADVGSGIAGYRLVTGTTAAAVPAGCLTGTVAYDGTAASFAQTFTAAGTIYARLCPKDALGNVSAGIAATVVLTAPVAGTRSANISGADNTLQVGNITGGTVFNDACPAGQALIGFGGSLSTATTAAVNRQIAGHCGIIQIVGTTVTVKAGAALTTRGPAGTSAWTRDCPANQVVVGFSGRAGLLVDQIALSCAPLAVAGSTVGSALTVGATPTALAAVGGTGGTAFAAVKCPAGEVATTARLRSGDNLDAFGLACGKGTVGN